MKLKTLMNKIESIYPLSLAEEWDNVGLQVGDPQKEVQKILTVLEVTDEVIKEAEEKGIDLIVAHHPLIFKEPIMNLNYNKNKKLIELIKNDIALYVMHTNIDIAYGGMNDWLCELLKINKPEILKITKKEPISKMEIEVNPIYMETILELLNKLGISKTNNNDENFLMGPKIKRFKKSGNKEVKEIDVVILSFAVTEEQIFLVKKALNQLKKENNIKTFIDIIPLKYAFHNYGIGRIGNIKTQTLEDYAKYISNKLDVEGVKFVGSREKLIKKVAICGGSGSSLIENAYYKKCDVLITGDVGFHDAQKALELGIAIIDVGHYMEIIFNDVMAEFLNMFNGIEAYPSEINTNPFEVL